MYEWLLLGDLGIESNSPEYAVLVHEQKNDLSNLYGIFDLHGLCDLSGHLNFMLTAWACIRVYRNF